ncbi:hypothetical protein CPLU01_09546 [Colletotrichum plurivorum]|uniref:Uncharacterized protein n=1 Tax=Colletotrichum plurivorum TaxID=2175906 RepID=A0A8H6K9L2_9PEZI|nr:hypothetical protein CPLU01_09546 [Colletotrichum plurivorum]
MTSPPGRLPTAQQGLQALKQVLCPVARPSGTTTRESQRPPNHRRRSVTSSPVRVPVTMTTPATADLASGLALIHALLEP